MNRLLEELHYFVVLMKTNFKLALTFVGIFWIVFLINIVCRGRLNLLGIYPRRWHGLPGIIFAPFLHSDFNHLFFNSIPLLILIDFVLFNGLNQFLLISVYIILLSGIMTWLLGRRGNHIGASSLVMGYMGYLLTHAYKNPTVLSILLAIICLYYFGSLFLGIFPTREKISWEGHLFGVIAGLATAYLL